MSAEAPWLIDPVVEDSEPWKKDPVVRNEAAPWESDPVVQEAAPNQITSDFKSGTEVPVTRFAGQSVNGPAGYTPSLETLDPKKYPHGITTDPTQDSILRAEERLAGIPPFALGPAGVQEALSKSQPGQSQEPLVELPKPENQGVGTGIVRGVEQVAEGLTTPENLALLTGLGRAGKVVKEGASLGFGVSMVKNAYDEITTEVPNETPGQKAERITRALLSLTLGGLAAKHGVDGRPMVGGATPAERIASTEAARDASMETVRTDAALAELQRQIQNEPLAGAAAEPTPPTTAPAPDAAASAPISEQKPVAEPVGAESAQTPAGEAQPVGGPGAMGPVEAKEMRDSNAVTGVKNAQVEAERIMRGEEPMTKEEPLPNRQAIAEAVQAIDKDPSRPDVIIEGINNSTRDARTISVADQAVLMAHKVDLMKQRLAQEEIYADGNRTPEEHVVAAQKLTELEKRMNAVDQATESMGTEGGRFLQLRQRLLRQDYSLEALERKARVAKGDALTPEESAKIKEQAKRIADLEKQLDEARKASAEKGATAAADEAVADLKKKAKPGKPLDMEAEGARLEKAIADRIKEGDKPEDLRDFVQRLALNLVRRGVTERDALIDRVHEVLKPLNIDRSTARDLISGYGDFKPLDKEAAKVTLRGLKGEMQQVAKIEDMQAKQAPKKTGMERRTPTDEERRLIKEVNELKKKGGFQVTDPETQLKTAREAIKTRLQNDIRDLDRAIATNEPLPKKTGGVEYDAEMKALKEQRDAKKAEYDKLFPKEPISDELMAARAEKAIDRSIEELEQQLKDGNLYPGKQGRKLSTPELDAKRARLEELRAQRQELRDIQNPKKTPEERALSAYKTRTANRIAELEQRLVWNDFVKAPKRELVLDKAALDLKAQIEKVKQEYNEGVLKIKRAQRSLPAKIFGVIPETLNTARAILTSFDFSAVLRQGGFTALGNPLRAARALPDMFRAFVSKDAQIRAMEQIKARPNFDLYGKAKLYLSDVGTETLSRMEEQYMSRWGKKIPIVAGSERAYTTFLNRLRADTFDALVNSLGGKKGITLDEAKVVANFVNAATGRGKLPGRLDASAAGFNTVFFSPRYVLSRLQLAVGEPLMGGNMRTRVAIAKEYGKFFAGAAIVYAMAQAAGAEVETDPRSSDFGKLKFGHTRVDILGGMLQNTVLLSKLTSGEKKDSHGKIVPIRGEKVPFGGETADETLFRFARTKFSPVLGAVFDLAARKNVVGQPVTALDVAKNQVIPMSLKDVYDTMVEQGIPKGTIFTILNIFGWGVQTYDENAKKKK